jgi:hypothetical protein
MTYWDQPRSGFLVMGTGLSGTAVARPGRARIEQRRLSWPAVRGQGGGVGCRCRVPGCLPTCLGTWPASGHSSIAGFRGVDFLAGSHAPPALASERVVGVHRLGMSDVEAINAITQHSNEFVISLAGP